MGQAASRQAAKQAQKVAGNSVQSSATAASAPRPPPLGRPVADAPAVTEDATRALQERQQKESQDLLRPRPAPPQLPQPDQNTGFYRGQISDPRDAAQERFLIQQSGAATKPVVMPEMDPDLLKFLQDMGPLEKKVNKELTSPRIVKELEQGKEGEESEKLHRFEAAQRTRNDMQLVVDIEGFSTPRTTNFFSSALAEVEEADFGLSDIEMYDLLKHRASTGSKDLDLGVSASFHQEKVGEDAGWTDEEREQQQQLVKDTLNVLALPVVVKDDDLSYIGLHQAELDKEFAHQNIDVVNESRVKLVVADLHDLGKKEIKRIR